MPNLIVISFTLMYPVFVVGIYCKGCVIVRESVKTQAIEVRRIFTGISQLSIPRKSGISVQWPVSLDVLDTRRVQSWTRVTYPTSSGHWPLDRSQVPHEKIHVPCTWLECEESVQTEIAVSREYLAGKAFPRDTHKTFYSARLYYLIHTFCTYTIYTHITHKC